MKNEMGRGCGLYGEKIGMHTEFWWGSLRERAAGKT